jgi:hypothetical protein
MSSALVRCPKYGKRNIPQKHSPKQQRWMLSRAENNTNERFLATGSDE